jgi:uncharacterized protein YkwD
MPGVERTLLQKINAVRVRRGLRRLKASTQLRRAARFHVRQMLDGGYFAHGAVWRRITSYYRPSGGVSAVGEDMAWGAPRLSAKEAIRLWLASPRHRRVILSPRWRRMGVGALHEARARGAYGTGPVTVIVADFGAP